MIMRQMRHRVIVRCVLAARLVYKGSIEYVQRSTIRLERAGRGSASDRCAGLPRRLAIRLCVARQLVYPHRFAKQCAGDRNG